MPRLPTTQSSHIFLWVWIMMCVIIIHWDAKYFVSAFLNIGLTCAHVQLSSPVEYWWFPLGFSSCVPQGGIQSLSEGPPPWAPPLGELLPSCYSHRITGCFWHTNTISRHGCSSLWNFQQQLNLYKSRLRETHRNSAARNCVIRSLHDDKNIAAWLRTRAFFMFVEVEVMCTFNLS